MFVTSAIILWPFLIFTQKERLWL